MPYRSLHVLVEGFDDEVFFTTILKPLLRSKYDLLRSYRYNTKPLESVKALMHSIDSMHDADYLFLTDLNASPCVTARRAAIEHKYKQRINPSRLMIVKREIEGWYLAGLDDEHARQLRLSPFRNTDGTTKEQFNSLIPGEFLPRNNFMQEVLRRFSIETARQKNASFAYFLRVLESL